MANPVLNERIMQSASTTWAPPDAGTDYFPPVDDRGSKQGLDKNLEWYAAFALLVTIIWLHLEILRLLAELRQR